ncbi:MAG TPA: hypothetical protein VJ441_03700 [Dehalococcoidia bacterium]|nr:hypothetical protein [Dehalococcoidia bacterium]
MFPPIISDTISTDWLLGTGNDLLAHYRIKAVLIDRYDLFPEITDYPRIKTLGEIVEQL